MSRYVTDTHPLFWFLTENEKLSSRASQIFREADVGLHQILIPGIVLVEMVYLVEKGLLIENLLEKLFAAITIPQGSYAVAELNSGTVKALKSILRNKVPDMPDRIITATAYQLGLPLITKDEKIQRAEIVQFVW